MPIRVVMEKISGSMSLGHRGSSACTHYTRSYMGECPKVGEFVAFGDEFPEKIVQVILRPAEWIVEYHFPPRPEDRRMISPETTWCLCRESLGPRDGETVHHPSKWQDGIVEGVA